MGYRYTSGRRGKHVMCAQAVEHDKVALSLNTHMISFTAAMESVSYFQHGE